MTKLAVKNIIMVRKTRMFTARIHAKLIENNLENPMHVVEDKKKYQFTS